MLLLLAVARDGLGGLTGVEPGLGEDLLVRIDVLVGLGHAQGPRLGRIDAADAEGDARAAAVADGDDGGQGDQVGLRSADVVVVVGEAKGAVEGVAHVLVTLGFEHDGRVQPARAGRRIVRRHVVVGGADPFGGRLAPFAGRGEGAWVYACRGGWL